MIPLFIHGIVDSAVLQKMDVLLNIRMGIFGPRLLETWEIFSGNDASAQTNTLKNSPRSSFKP